MTIAEDIDDYQHKLDMLLLGEKSTLSYKDTVLPLAQELKNKLDMLEILNYPKVQIVESSINIYVEALVLKLLDVIDEMEEEYKHVDVKQLDSSSDRKDSHKAKSSHTRESSRSIDKSKPKSKTSRSKSPGSRSSSTKTSSRTKSPSKSKRSKSVKRLTDDEHIDVEQLDVDTHVDSSVDTSNAHIYADHTTNTSDEHMYVDSVVNIYVDTHVGQHMQAMNALTPQANNIIRFSSLPDHKPQITTKLPIYFLTWILVKHPYLLCLIQFGISYNNWLQMRKDILHELNIIFGDDSILPEVLKVRDMLSTELPKSWTEYVKKFSAIQCSNFLVSFNWREDLISIDYAELNKKLSELSHGNDYSILLINVAYKIENTNSIVMYHNIPKLKDKLLNINTIGEFKAYDVAKNVKKQLQPFTCVSSKLKEISLDKMLNCNFIVMCYNNDVDISKCKFTVALDCEHGYVNKSKVYEFLNGTVHRIFSKDEIDYYLETNFYRNIADKPENVDDLRMKYFEFTKLVQEVFSYSTRRNFAINILKHPKIKNIFDPKEMPFFSVYVGSVASMLMYDLPTVTKHCTDYIFPDLPSNIHKF